MENAMRRLITIMSMIILAVFVLSGCGTRESNPDATADQNPSGNGEEQYTFRAELIEAGVSLLITPSEESNEIRSSDRISVALSNAVLTGETGVELKAEDLQPGDILMITYNGIIAESYPAQITASKVERVDHNNLLDGYLALIDDIYQEDSGLNSEITTIAFDTSEWVNLTNIEKEMIFAKVKEAYGFEVIEGTFEELAEQKLIDKDNLYFPTGILIKISDITYDEKKEEITCAISKWRSGLGSIGADQVTALLKNGTWEITKDGMWIS
jgi:hypothetical protein